MRVAIGVAAILFGLIVSGCGGSDSGNPASPSSSSYSGTWSGTTNSLIGRLNIQLSLTQTGNSLSGTYSCTSVGCAFPTGSVTGTVTGDSLSGTLSFLNGAATCGTFTGRRSGNTISGNYSCSWGDSGTWSVAR